MCVAATYKNCIQGVIGPINDSVTRTGFKMVSVVAHSLSDLVTETIEPHKVAKTSLSGL